MRHLHPQTFLLLVAAAALLLGCGLWWMSRLVARRPVEAPLQTFRKPQPPPPAQPQASRALQPVAPALPVVEEPASAETLSAPAAQPEAAKILRRTRGFSTGSQPALGTGSQATVHVAAKRPKPLA